MFFVINGSVTYICSTTFVYLCLEMYSHVFCDKWLSDLYLLHYICLLVSRDVLIFFVINGSVTYICSTTFVYLCLEMYSYVFCDKWLSDLYLLHYICLLVSRDVLICFL